MYHIEENNILCYYINDTLRELIEENMKKIEKEKDFSHINVFFQQEFKVGAYIRKLKKDVKKQYYDKFLLEYPNVIEAKNTEDEGNFIHRLSEILLSSEIKNLKVVLICDKSSNIGEYVDDLDFISVLYKPLSQKEVEEIIGIS